MFQYFLKVVSTQFRTLDGQTVNTHQYSVTHFERDITTGSQGGQNEGVHIQHGTSGIPGSRSPLKSGLYYSSLMCFSQQVLSSTMKFLRSWWSTRKRGNPLPTSSPRALPLDAYVVLTLTLLPRTCAIVGGVLTVASILDSVLFATGRHLKKTGTSSSNGNGHPSGKLM